MPKAEVDNIDTTAELEAELPEKQDDESRYEQEAVDYSLSAKTWIAVFALALSTASSTMSSTVGNFICFHVFT